MPLTPEQTGNINRAVRIVEQLAAAGHKVPVPLTAAIAAYTAAQYVKPEPIDIDSETAKIKAADVADLVARAVDAKLRADATPPVRAEIVERLGRRLLRDVRAAAPAIVDALADDFNAAATTFTDAVRQLPKGWQDPAALVDAGPDTVGIFQTARAALHTLDDLADVRDHFANLGVTAVDSRHREHVTIEQATRYCTVRNTGAARRILPIKTRNEPLGRWGQILETDGVEALCWRTFADHAAYVAALPAVEDHYEESTDTGFRGAFHKVEA